MRDVTNIVDPPEDLHICFGGGDFRKIGQKMIAVCKDKLEFASDEKVLDIGCGVGRLAFPLLEYLNESGGYEGFDTFPAGVKWCSENITPEFSNFNFKQVDIFNTTYNPYAQTKASEFIFPYEDNTFDLVLLNSVFTHMMPDDIINYLSEIDRVLNDNGRVFVTFFLINKESLELMDLGKSVHDFHKFGVFYTADPKEPMDAVGYDEQFAFNLFEKHNFKIKEVMYGNWSGIKSGNHQDIVLLTR
ncbi:Methyltransferase domain-containing protein [Maridesulfovibrio ferrireducens]|uniref:Methyltransferase domain-containing protein n=1 Tax=Maridesulfovibrio ferrireducens TaxID=246191 RepID=A0A1G9HYV2_9BACT|nr:class I SAM-dependent methyltransferase [Maridesulfovibrio ferrireducens]SDL17844.1 Methyltransferase domain-containing protein [Maridesulfovibrio ferrireducens]